MAMHVGQLRTQHGAGFLPGATHTDEFQHQPGLTFAGPHADRLRCAYGPAAANLIEPGGFCCEHLQTLSLIEFDKVPAALADQGHHLIDAPACQ